MYHERWGQISALIIFWGFNQTFFTQFFLGSRGMPRRYYNYLTEFQGLHQISTIGAYILGLGLFSALFCLIHSLMKGPKAPQNPWGALTLEWTHASSPPIEHNFHETPKVTRGPYDYE